MIDYSLESLQRIYGKPVDHISHSYTKWMSRYERYGSVIEWLRDHDPLWGEIAEAVNEYVRRKWEVQPTPLTDRQIHYYLVGSKPEVYMNTLKYYNKLIDLILGLRLSGELDWDWISEQESEVEYNGFFSWELDEKDAIDRALGTAESYVFQNPWDYQDERVMVITEKRELKPQLSWVCDSYMVDLVCCKSYGVWSTMVHKVAKRVKLYLRHGMRVTLVFATDHDPSGLDINRFYMAILRFKWNLNENVEYYRLMLNMDQVERLKLPPYPAKVRDPRYKWYVRAFGDWSWEVDALEREGMQRILEEYIKSKLDESSIKEARRREEEQRRRIRERVEEIKKYLREIGIL